MIFRFWYELAVGVITLISVIILGEPGQAAFALLAFLPIILRIKKYKPDERELILFYKAGNYSAVLILAALLGLGFAGKTDFFMEHWLFITASSFLIAHGLAGIVVFRFGN